MKKVFLNEVLTRVHSFDTKFLISVGFPQPFHSYFILITSNFGSGKIAGEQILSHPRQENTVLHHPRLFGSSHFWGLDRGFRPLRRLQSKSHDASKFSGYVPQRLRMRTTRSYPPTTNFGRNRYS